MTDGDLQIIAPNVRYWHPSDERAFFEWLDRMPCVRDYHGVVRDLFINFRRFPTHDDLWEIIGFCRRYEIDLAQLAKFVTDENSRWLPDEISWDPSQAAES
ncbi:hypothetical protein [Sphingomonas bacterium]|uniref:hypothetical protein n=1 Tax=Sphingomonas bacterium TaxID=1895847 RepID=UPI002611BA1A|nr:hypothetical protein [Sphingomonas bacterium]MDB5678367.1 hypothetical protein [Sphingomonas bacterium]